MVAVVSSSQEHRVPMSALRKFLWGRAGSKDAASALQEKDKGKAGNKAAAPNANPNANASIGVRQGAAKHHHHHHDHHANASPKGGRKLMADSEDEEEEEGELDSGDDSDTENQEPEVEPDSEPDLGSVDWSDDSSRASFSNLLPHHTVEPGSDASRDEEKRAKEAVNTFCWMEKTANQISRHRRLVRKRTIYEQIDKRSRLSSRTARDQEDAEGDDISDAEDDGREEQMTECFDRYVTGVSKGYLEISEESVPLQRALEILEHLFADVAPGVDSDSEYRKLISHYFHKRNFNEAGISEDEGGKEGDDDNDTRSEGSETSEKSISHGDDEDEISESHITPVEWKDLIPEMRLVHAMAYFIQSTLSSRAYVEAYKALSDSLSHAMRQLLHEIEESEDARLSSHMTDLSIDAGDAKVDSRKPSRGIGLKNHELGTVNPRYKPVVAAFKSLVPPKELRIWPSALEARRAVLHESLTARFGSLEKMPSAAMMTGAPVVVFVREPDMKETSADRLFADILEKQFRETCAIDEREIRVSDQAMWQWQAACLGSSMVRVVDIREAEHAQKALQSVLQTDIVGVGFCPVLVVLHVRAHSMLLGSSVLETIRSVCDRFNVRFHIETDANVMLTLQSPPAGVNRIKSCSNSLLLCPTQWFGMGSTGCATLADPAFPAATASTSAAASNAADSGGIHKSSRDPHNIEGQEAIDKLRFDSEADLAISTAISEGGLGSLLAAWMMMERLGLSGLTRLVGETHASLEYLAGKIGTVPSLEVSTTDTGSLIISHRMSHIDGAMRKYKARERLNWVNRAILQNCVEHCGYMGLQLVEQYGKVSILLSVSESLRVRKLVPLCVKDMDTFAEQITALSKAYEVSVVCSTSFAQKMSNRNEIELIDTSDSSSLKAVTAFAILRLVPDELAEYEASHHDQSQNFDGVSVVSVKKPNHETPLIADRMSHAFRRVEAEARFLQERLTEEIQADIDRLRNDPTVPKEDLEFDASMDPITGSVLLTPSTNNSGIHVVRVAETAVRVVGAASDRVKAEWIDERLYLLLDESIQSEEDHEEDNELARETGESDQQEEEDEQEQEEAEEEEEESVPKPASVAYVSRKQQNKLLQPGAFSRSGPIDKSKLPVASHIGNDEEMEDDEHGDDHGSHDEEKAGEKEEDDDDDEEEEEEEEEEDIQEPAIALSGQDHSSHGEEDNQYEGEVGEEISEEDEENEEGEEKEGDVSGTTALHDDSENADEDEHDQVESSQGEGELLDAGAEEEEEGEEGEMTDGDGDEQVDSEEGQELHREKDLLVVSSIAAPTAFRSAGTKTGTKTDGEPMDGAVMSTEAVPSANKKAISKKASKSKRAKEESSEEESSDHNARNHRGGGSDDDGNDDEDKSDEDSETTSSEEESEEEGEEEEEESSEEVVQKKTKRTNQTGKGNKSKPEPPKPASKPAKSGKTKGVSTAAPTATAPVATSSGFMSYLWGSSATAGASTQTAKKGRGGEATKEVASSKKPVGTRGPSKKKEDMESSASESESSEAEQEQKPMKSNGKIAKSSKDSKKRVEVSESESESASGSASGGSQGELSSSISSRSESSSNSESEEHKAPVPVKSKSKAETKGKVRKDKVRKDKVRKSKVGKGKKAVSSSSDHSSEAEASSSQGSASNSEHSSSTSESEQERDIDRKSKKPVKTGKPGGKKINTRKAPRSETESEHTSDTGSKEPSSESGESDSESESTSSKDLRTKSRGKSSKKVPSKSKSSSTSKGASSKSKSKSRSKPEKKESAPSKGWFGLY